MQQGSGSGSQGRITTAFFAGGGRSIQPLVMQENGGDFYVRSLTGTPINRHVANANHFLWGKDNFDTIPLFAQFRPATNVLFGINDQSGALLLSATADSTATPIPAIVYGKSINLTTDGTTYPFTLTNNVTTLGTTTTHINGTTHIGFVGAISKFMVTASKNLFSWDTSEPSAGFFEIMPSGSAVLLVDAVSAAMRLSSYSTNFGAAQPIIFQANSLNFTANGSSYPLVVSNGITTLAALSTPVASVTGNLNMSTGSNKPAGTFTLVAGTATVTNTTITANSVVHVTLKTLGGTRAGNPDIVPTAGTGFVATGAGTDTSIYNYWIENNN